MHKTLYDISREQVAPCRCLRTPIDIIGNYNASALLNVDLCNSHRNSVCLSVSLSVTFLCFVQRDEDTIVRFSASGIKIILVSGEIN